MEKSSSRLNFGLILTLLITVAGWSLNYGVCQNKIEQNTKNLTRLEQEHKEDVNKLNDRQDNTETLLRAINTQLVELNTKMTLLLNGKVKTAE